MIERVLQLAHTAQPLTTGPAITESGQRLCSLHLQISQTLNPLIDDYQTRIARLFDAHPEAPIFSGLPGAGPALAPRLLSFFGTDRHASR